MAENITVEVLVNAPIEKVWEYWTQPEHITKWNFASNDWCCPRATSDLKVGGEFSSRMESTDGKMGFDFAGVFTAVEPNQKLAYTLGDRTAEVLFSSENGMTKVTETFEAETENSIELQRNGWQSILNNFKQHVESN